MWPPPTYARRNHNVSSTSHNTGLINSDSTGLIWPIVRTHVRLKYAKVRSNNEFSSTGQTTILKFPIVQD